MSLHNKVRQFDEVFPALLSQLVDLHELGRAQAAGGHGARLVELVQADYREYIMELGEIIERLTFLNTNLSRLIIAAKKILEEKN